MKKCISFGKFKNKYKYILYSAIALIIYDISFGLNYKGAFKEVSLINLFEVDENSKEHSYIHEIFCYFGTFFVSLILYILEKKGILYESIELRNSSKQDNSSSQTFLICLISLWVIEEKLAETIKNILIHLDFWVLEFIFLSYFCKKILKIDIYKHQKVAMLLTIIPCIIKIATIVLSFYDENRIEENFNNFRRKDGLLEILYVPYPWLIPIGLSIYIIMLIMEAYIMTKIKWYMDLEYFSFYKILMLYGFFGTIIYTTFCIITTFIECPKGYKDLYDYFCKTKDDNNQKYFANFILYYTNILSQIPLEEIIIVLFGISGFFSYKFFSFMIIKDLSPIHLVFSLPLFYIIRKIILIINILIHNDFIVSKFYEIKFKLDISADSICLFGYFIYLEIIKLNFLGLNYNITENIMSRSQTDLTLGKNINDDCIIKENDMEDSN